MFTSVDYEKFRALRITQVALQLEELLKDDGNDLKTPEELFLTAVDEALEVRRSNRIDKLIGKARFPIPHASIEEIRYMPERGVSSVRMQRYAAHDWRADPTNLLANFPHRGRENLHRLRDRDRRVPCGAIGPLHPHGRAGT